MYCYVSILSIIQYYYVSIIKYIYYIITYYVSITTKNQAHNYMYGFGLTWGQPTPDFTLRLL